MTKKNENPLTQENDQIPETTDRVLSDIRAVIEKTRSTVAATVNAGLSLMYWRVGVRIQKEVLKGERADYGKEILPALSAKLASEYGRGWSDRNLSYMVSFAEVFPDSDILQTLCAKLSWSHRWNCICAG